MIAVRCVPHSTRSYPQAESVLEAILNTEYNRAMNEHYQWPAIWETNGTAQTPVPVDSPEPHYAR